METNTPRISIIIPVYNLEGKLSRCLDSVLQQTYLELQIILVDDGSTDQSAEICRAYAQKDPRIELIRKENGGVSSARNLGLEHAAGKYVTFVDGDDWISERYVEECVLRAEESGADIVIGGLTKIENGVETVKSPKEGDYDRKGFLQMVCRNGTEVYGYVPNKLYRRGLLNRAAIRFDEKMHSQEDLAFALLAYEAAEHIVCFSFSEYYYNKVPSNRILPPEHLLGNQIKLFQIAEASGTETGQMVPRFQRLLYTVLYHAASAEEIWKLESLKIPEPLLADRTENRSEIRKLISWFARKKYKRIFRYFRIRHAVRRLVKGTNNE